MIQQYDVERVLDAANIVDVVKQHVTLKKKGSNYQGLCPFHDEKTPSFSVNEDKNMYYCFGCGAGGDAVNFIRNIEHVSFPKAVKKLAKQFNIAIDEKEQTEDDKKRLQFREQLFEFYAFANDFYSNQVWKPENTLATEYLHSRFDAFSIREFNLGVAPDSWQGLTDAAKEKGYKEEFLLKTGLIKQSEKSHKLYDFFRNRIMFPIKNRQGIIVSFGGRALPWNKDVKYLNTSETDIYSKKQQLYGLFNGRKSIANNGAIITEGYPDVVGMHAQGYENTVAPCGTAFNEAQADLLKNLTKHIILFTDGDQAGLNATMKTGKMLMSKGFHVYVAIAEPKKDAYDHASEGTVDELINMAQDFIMFSTAKLLDDTKTQTDPVTKNNALKEIAANLKVIPDNLLMQEYQNAIIEKYKKSHGITKNSFSQLIKSVATPEMESAALEMDEEELPHYLTKDDKLDYIKYGFYESKEGKERNQIYFKKTGRASNFIIKPLYHIVSVNDTRKLFELTNKYDETRIVEMDMLDINSIQKFCQKIEAAGNFLWEGNQNQFIKLKRMLYDKTKYCFKIERLGWQESAGFWAWANGISTKDGNFIPVDNYGIVEYEGKHYFIPAYSSIYMHDESVYTDERKLIFIQNKEDSFYSFVELFLKVHDDKSMLSILFYIATIFADYIFKYQGNFPILNFFGEKGSGKNEQAYTLASLFGIRQNELQLNNVTKPGLAAQLELFSNAFSLLDEYKVGIDPDVNESLKGIYNRNGRSKGSIKEGIKRERTPVTTTAILMGQEQTTQDVALFERLIYMSYAKRRRTSTEIANFEKMMALREKGLSQFTHNLIKFREVVEKNYRDNFPKVKSDFSDAVNAENITDRLINNYTTLLTIYRTLENYINLPFSYDQAFQMAVHVADEHSKQLSNSDELGQFWNMIETLFERKEIHENLNFRLEIFTELRLNREQTRHFKPGKELLLLRWSGIYQAYAESSVKSRQKPIPENTLIYYLETSSSFLGKKQSVRFSDSVNQAFVFDYNKLGINLIKYGEGAAPQDDLTSEGSVKDKTDTQGDDIPDDGLPF